MWNTNIETMTSMTEEYDPDLCECTRLITNTFTINSAGISPATRQQEQQARGTIRRQNMAPQHMNFDLKCDSPGKEPMESEDVSFYSGHSPQASPTRPCPISPGLSSLASESPIQCSLSRVNFVRQLSHQDTESADSGYTTSESIRSAPISGVTNMFQFAEPRQPLSDPSPGKTPSKYIMEKGGAYNNICSLISPSSNFKTFGSFSSGSMDSMDDEYRDLIEMEAFEDDNQIPSNLSSLISQEIKSTRTTPEVKRNLVRSLFEKSPVSTTPKSSLNVLITTPERQCLQSISENMTPRIGGGFKRPEPPTISPNRSKRHKNENDAPFPVITSSEAPKRPLFRKSMSMNDASVANVLDDPSLIGDYSKKLCLPLITDRQSDLKAISVDTMMALLNGLYSNSVASFKVIDCRYPYEFAGGHIKGARNLYMQEQILAELVSCKTEAPQVAEDGPKRNILVFHCEFSSERGPKLSRFLRSFDRESNKAMWPALHYPEIYLLHGGYKLFYETYPNLCDPVSYRPMLEPEFADVYRVFRAKSKSWTGDSRVSSSSRTLTKTRSRLLL